MSAAILEVGARALEGAASAWRGPGVASQFAAARNRAPVFARVVRDGTARYERTTHHWIPGEQSFAADKGPATTRIFVLGGSAAMGWPHRGQHSIAGLLGEKLRRLHPGRSIEVLNTAGNTYASFRVRVVLEEIVGYQPDAVVLYTGNNEFIEDLVYHPLAALGTPRGVLGRSALLRVGGRGVARLLARPTVIDVTNYGERDMRANRLSFAFGRASRLRSDPAQLQAVREHYRQNLESMVRTCQERRIPVVLLAVPVNLKDWVPNVSVHGGSLSAQDRARWQARFREGYVALEAGRWREAAHALAEAAALDPEHAESHFRHGQALLRLGARGEARAALQRALHTDAYPFRSIVDDVLRDVTARTGAPSVDVVAALEAATPDGILGLDALVDYVHPTVASNEVLAHEALVALIRAGASPPADASTVRIATDPAVESDPLVLRALYRQFLVMRQYDHLPALAARLRAALERDVAAGVKAKKSARVLADLDATEAILAPYARLLRAEKLGVLDQEMAPADAERTFQAYVEIIRRLEGGDMADQEFRNFVPSMGHG